MTPKTPMIKVGANVIVSQSPARVDDVENGEALNRKSGGCDAKQGQSRHVRAMSNEL